MACLVIVLCLFLVNVHKANSNLECQRNQEKIDTEGISGYIGDEFCIILVAIETHMLLESMCVNDIDSLVTYTVTSSLKGISQVLHDMEDNSIVVKNSNGEPDGSAVLIFSSRVTLYYTVTPINHPILPVDKLGKEYFIAFPKVKSREYEAKIAFLYNSTSVMVEMNNGNSGLDHTYHTNMTMNHTLGIRRTFDFSGSRVLSTMDIAVICFMNSKNDPFEFTMTQQLYPTRAFGKQYYVYDRTGMFYDLVPIISLRLVAIFANTIVESSDNSTADLGRRGQTANLVLNARVSHLSSEKNFIAVRELYYEAIEFLVPAEQLQTFSVLTIFSLDTYIYVNLMKTENRSFSLGFYDYEWTFTPINYTLKVLYNDSGSSIGKLETTIPDFEYVSVTNTPPLDVWFVAYFEDGFIEVIQMPGSLDALFESCRLVDCTGDCNHSFVESCDQMNTEGLSTVGSTTNVGLIVTIGSVVVVAGMVGLYKGLKYYKPSSRTRHRSVGST
ncbi:hypothetical protein ScPMuIL_011534 [Solemya velum]